MSRINLVGLAIDMLEQGLGTRVTSAIQHFAIPLPGHSGAPRILSTIEEAVAAVMESLPSTRQGNMIDFANARTTWDTALRDGTATLTIDSVGAAQAETLYTLFSRFRSAAPRFTLKEFLEAIWKTSRGGSKKLSAREMVQDMVPVHDGTHIISLDGQTFGWLRHGPDVSTSVYIHGPVEYGEHVMTQGGVWVRAADSTLLSLEPAAFQSTHLLESGEAISDYTTQLASIVLKERSAFQTAAQHLQQSSLASQIIGDMQRMGSLVAEDSPATPKILRFLAEEADHQARRATIQGAANAIIPVNVDEMVLRCFPESVGPGILPYDHDFDQLVAAVNQRLGNIRFGVITAGRGKSLAEVASMDAREFYGALTIMDTGWFDGFVETLRKAITDHKAELTELNRGWAKTCLSSPYPSRDNVAKFLAHLKATKSPFMETLQKLPRLQEVPEEIEFTVSVH